MRRTSGVQRNGFTLIEMLIVFALISIMVAFAVPRARAVKDRAYLRAARDQIAVGLAAARASAVQKGQLSTFVMRNDTMRVALGALADGTSIIGARNLNELYGVRVTLASPDDSLLTYDARGYVTPLVGGRHTYRVTVNSLTDSVCVSKLGLTLKNGCLP
jgi:prepilin-type N-terminal cleavage/methylation domain-containing protein